MEKGRGCKGKGDGRGKGMGMFRCVLIVQGYPGRVEVSWSRGGVLVAVGGILIAVGGVLVVQGVRAGVFLVVWG
jgi:hypothetical protein